MEGFELPWTGNGQARQSTLPRRFTQTLLLENIEPMCPESQDQCPSGSAAFCSHTSVFAKADILLDFD
jgi:hypothetical protein